MVDYLFLHPSSVTITLHVLVVLGLAVRIIMKRPATGVALAWILLIAIAPLAGAVIYLLIGERRIGYHRAQRLEEVRSDFRQAAKRALRHGLVEVEWDGQPADVRGMDRIGRTLTGFPTVRGSRYQLYSDPHEILAAIARDVDAAERSVLMEFYIWQAGGDADDVLEAIVRAARRGVYCCLLVDAVGARPWWRSDQPRRLREAGVRLLPALPVSLPRTFVGRTDLRLHRKIVVIDGQVAWTGSINLVDPRFFKQNSGVGQWVDAMLRLEGGVVLPLAATLIGDWLLESDDSLEEFIAAAKLGTVEPNGPADIQVIPSGPGEYGDAQLQMILALLHSAREEVVLTTPYLVPDESLLRAICGAAARGVAVRLIVPEKVDSLLARYASRSYFDDLFDRDVEIHLYRSGMLHTKSITVDGAKAMFGTVNLDMRSLWLNYEVSLFVYDESFTRSLRELQQSYLDDSDHLDASEWARRSFGIRLVENTVRLASPLL